MLFVLIFLASRSSTRSSKEDVTYVSGIGFCHRVRFDRTSIRYLGGTLSIIGKRR